MINNHISIVTMFFDIGRGDWSKQAGIADFANRDNDKYFAYFAHLAKLDNDMVVFTTPNFDERILALRENRPTRIVHVDLDNQFGEYIDQISAIQNNPQFINRIPEELHQHPEYRSPKYVLINNLKTYFVNQAIEQGLTRHLQVAWVDFGYCRDNSTLGDIKEWRYDFDPKFLHLFTLKNPYYLGFIKNIRFPHTIDKAYYAIFHNRPTIIGGVIVANHLLWKEFFDAVCLAQKQLLSENIIDDDQGIYLLSYLKNKYFIKLNFLGKANWFGVFQQFHQ